MESANLMGAVLQTKHHNINLLMNNIKIALQQMVIYFTYVPSKIGVLLCLVGLGPCSPGGEFKLDAYCSDNPAPQQKIDDDDMHQDCSHPGLVDPSFVPSWMEVPSWIGLQSFVASWVDVPSCLPIGRGVQTWCILLILKHHKAKLVMVSIKIVHWSDILPMCLGGLDVPRWIGV